MCYNQNFILLTPNILQLISIQVSDSSNNMKNHTEKQLMTLDENKLWPSYISFCGECWAFNLQYPGWHSSILWLPLKAIWFDNIFTTKQNLHNALQLSINMQMLG